MVVLDSSFLIDIRRNRVKAVQLLSEFEKNNQTLFVAAPTITELWQGALLSNIPESEKRIVTNLLSSLKVLPLGEKEAKSVAELNVSLRNNPIEVIDLMIAAITLVNGDTLVTRDEHFTRIPGLTILKY